MIFSPPLLRLFCQVFYNDMTAFTLFYVVQSHKQKDNTCKPFIRSYCESF